MTALAIAGAVGQTGAAADAPKDRSTLAASECTVCIVGNVVVQWRGTSGSFHVDRVENRSHSPLYMSRNLGLQVQLQPVGPNAGRDSGGGSYGVSDVVPLGSLAEGTSRSDIDSGRIAFDGSGVPAGEYAMVVAIVDDYPAWPHVDAFAVLDDKVWCDSSGCAIGRPCSVARIAGEWGYTKTGTVILPTGAAPFATLGILSLGADGRLSGVNTGSVGGKIGEDVLLGTFEMKPDCTGTAIVEVHDKSSGALLRTIGMNVVVDEGQNHLRGIVTSLVLPNGVGLPSIITADARRVSPSSNAQ